MDNAILKRYVKRFWKDMLESFYGMTTEFQTILRGVLVEFQGEIHLNEF